MQSLSDTKTKVWNGSHKTDFLRRDTHERGKGYLLNKSFFVEAEVDQEDISFVFILASLFLGSLFKMNKFHKVWIYMLWVDVYHIFDFP